MKLLIIPNGWETTLQECEPGFLVFKKQLCFKTEYGECEAYNSCGETLCIERNSIVQPVKSTWEEE